MSSAAASTTAATTNDQQWIFIILHGDRYWDILYECLVPWSMEYPAFDTFQTLYCDDEIMENTPNAPHVRSLMERLFQPKNESQDSCDACQNSWDALEENGIAAGGFLHDKENSETSQSLIAYPKAIHAILHTSINVV